VKNHRYAAWVLATCVMAATTPARAQSQPDPDRVLNPAQPDVTLVNLPTSMRIPLHRGSFRLSHRFSRPLGQGDFTDLVQDAFGFDSSANIGIEFRYGLMRGLQIGVYRTNDRTIEFFGQYSAVQQGERMPLSIDAYAAVDGTDNFTDSYTPVLGAIVSRTIGRHAALYAEPMWVNNSNPLPKEVVDDNDTFLVGLGARLRIRPSVYLVYEAVPRVGGYEPGGMQQSFAIERRAGGHLFQLNFSNGTGSAWSQLARGGPGTGDWYIGFNLSRKFF